MNTLSKATGIGPRTGLRSHTSATRTPVAWSAGQGNGETASTVASESARYDRKRTTVQHWARPATPAERLKFKWFCVGVCFSWAVVTLLVLWVDAGSP